MKIRIIILLLINFVVFNVFGDGKAKYNIKDKELMECVVNAVEKAGNTDNVLDLSCINKKIKTIEGIKVLKNLKKLNLNGNSIVDISELVELKKLEWLNMSNCHIFKEAENSSKYKSLVIDGVNLTKIKDIKSLKRLELSKCNLSKITSTASDSVEFLDLSYNYIDDVDFIKKFKNISQLDISNNQVKDPLPLFEKETLKILYASHNKINKINLEKSSYLEELSLDGNYLSDASFISHLPKLKFLNIINNCFTSVPTTKLDNTVTVMEYMKPSEMCKEKDLQKNTYESVYIEKSDTEKIIKTARNYINKRLNIKNFENARAAIFYKNKGQTKQVRNVCGKKDSKCKVIWDNYDIVKPMWEIVFNTCKQDNCLGEVFVIYIDNKSKEVLYYGGYK